MRGDKGIPAKTKRKILKSGGSRVIALPPDWLCALGLKPGDDVEVLYGSIVIIKPKHVDLDAEMLRREFSPLIDSSRNLRKSSR